jgi:phospholipid/cholesterol/gamma-HCH transport system substrate-binding protein
VAGLDRRAIVRISGVRVGYVEDIFLRGTRATVRLRIGRTVEVPEDSNVTLASFGMLGEKYVEIMPGKSSRPCPPRGRLNSVASVSLDQLGLLLLSIGNEIRGVGTSLQSLMNEGNRQKVQSTLENLASLTANLDRFLQDNGQSLGNGVRDASQAAKEVSRTVQDVSQDLHGLLDENRGLVKSNLEKIQELLKKIEDSVRKLDETLDKLNQGQGTLGRLLQDPELYDETRQTVDGVRKTVGSLNSLTAAFEAQSEYYGHDGLFKNSLGFDLMLGGRSLVRGGITKDPWLDAFTYSLQVGRRFGPLSPRVGLIESDFGLGLDYEALDRRLRFSLDTFAFNRDAGPRFRVSSRLFPVKSLYLVLGVDDFSLAANRQFYFGLGLEAR